ncbi:MAG: Bifunctional purine biosynthesis protein PurH [Candidatus Azambacteria bacterium GW2011_GWA1_44_9]|uniref:Bifunctional purine biosynthesis protein PurH n=1 Tax=Candidatus Azambacteria bacterium GW2011_GWA1_44_9 TaxID=1618610 RepID=A0A0G1KB12_9BACT|nr:MAG: Bifunctional purine biosynthesis protein PurH [Candidatus Azambacteria bacterium GW2011_GWA1_44_9]
MDLPKDLNLNLKKYRDMRYGENPHQKSAFYLAGKSPGYEQLWGIELSHNNIGDANQAWSLVLEFEKPTVAIIKHANPSGITSRSSLTEAFRMACGADSTSAFGGIVAVNRLPTVEMIEAMRGIFFELIIAPYYTDEVIERLKKRSAKMRVIRASKLPKQLEFTRAFSGYLVQTGDDVDESPKRWKVVTGKKLSKKVTCDCEFAWKVVKHVKSNAVVVKYAWNGNGPAKSGKFHNACPSTSSGRFTGRAKVGGNETQKYNRGGYGIRRVFSVSRQCRTGSKGGNCRDYPAWRFNPRRRCNCRCQETWNYYGIYGSEAF